MSAVPAPARRRADRRPALTVVEPARPVPTLLYALLTILLVGSAVFGTVTLNALGAAHAVEARELEARIAESERTYAQLVADVASREDPQRIREEALDLGMVPAGPSRHLTLERALPADGVTDGPLPGTAADPLKPVLSVDR